MASETDLMRWSLLGFGLLATVPVLAAGPVEKAGESVDCRAVERESFSMLPMLTPSSRGGRKGAPYCEMNLRAGVATVRNGQGGFDNEPAGVEVRQGAFTVSAIEVGNYHWVQATEDGPQGVITASTAHYFSNPGPAPSAMLRLAKADLEIIPQPLPREHWRYRAGETWDFLVRFRGQPLAGMGVRLETGGGTQRVFTTDAEGMVKVTFPMDVAHGGPRGAHDHGRGGRNPFVLAVGLTDPEGRYYLTGFNHVYGAAADAGRSLPFGLGFLALGGFMALPLVMKRKERVRG